MTSKKLRSELLSEKRLSEQFFESLLESAPDAMVIVDRSGEIAIVNGQAEEMFGYTREEMQGKKIEFLLPERIRERHIGHRTSYTADPTLRPMGIGMELHGCRRDGTEFPVEISLSPVSTEAGSFVSSVIRDVTKRKEMEIGLIEARQDAERANRANSAFLAAASHDLRQPVQALSLLNGALRRTVTEERALEMLNSQNQSLTAMTNLLNSLLDISRLDAGAVTPAIEEFPIDRLIDQLSSEFSRQAIQQGLSFESTHCGASVRTDPILLTEIIQNLVSNSLRYTESGSVRLVCKKSGSDCRVEVRDTGIGIESDQIEKIFDAFHQCKTPGSSKEGFGLGLAIVSRLADLLGHEVNVESTPGQGSCFCITLPLVEKQVDTTNVRSASVDTKALHKAVGLVVLIEDDEPVADALKLLFETEGYTVATATTKSEAIVLMEHLHSTPVLIVSDYHLADSSTGVETIAAIRNSSSDKIPALIITGDTSQAVADARNVANSVLLSKPIDPDYLLKLAKTATTSGLMDEAY